MHKKIVLLVVLTVAMLGVAAQPASATQVPFSVGPVPFNGVTQPIPGHSENPGFFGVCLSTSDCYGFGVHDLVYSGGLVSVGDSLIHVAGVVCISNQADPCGEPGAPGTGIIFQPEPTVLIPDHEKRSGRITTTVCVWNGDPRFEPSICKPIEVEEVDHGMTGWNALALIPDRIML